MTEKLLGGGEGLPGSSEYAHTLFVCVCSKSKLCWLPPSRTKQKSGVGSPRRSPGEAAGPPTTTVAIAARKVEISCAVITARPPSTSNAGEAWGPLWIPSANPRRLILLPGLPLPAKITGSLQPLADSLQLLGRAPPRPRMSAGIRPFCWEEQPVGPDPRVAVVRNETNLI